MCIGAIKNSFYYVVSDRWVPQETICEREHQVFSALPRSEQGGEKKRKQQLCSLISRII